jgi:hypothetical protein
MLCRVYMKTALKSKLSIILYSLTSVESFSKSIETLSEDTVILLTNSLAIAHRDYN